MKKLETMRLTHENRKVTVHLYYWDNTETVANKGLQDAYKNISAQNQELRKKIVALLDYAKNTGRYNELYRRALVENMER